MSVAQLLPTCSHGTTRPVSARQRRLLAGLATLVAGCLALSGCSLLPDSQPTTAPATAVVPTTAPTGLDEHYTCA
ncbi:hypothetical protein, partial [Actinomyces sp. MRS3W]|uniref:hypothetical protein n=1 Tax=Actinomyces sp. MRS3W TaxID=2800796 RepID=UPI0028FD7CD7